MSEYKFACPVCGQHIMCDSSRAGSVMECPTCFQKIVASQAPSTNDSKFILAGTKAAERPNPTLAPPKTVQAKRGSPLGAMIWIAMVVVMLAGAFIFRGNLFKLFITTSPTAHGTNVSGQATNQH